MSGQWYYAHDGETHGPFSEEEIQDRVAQRLLLESDSVWPAGREKKHAAPATAVFDFSQVDRTSFPRSGVGTEGSHTGAWEPGRLLPAPVSAMPDWLTDVAAAETTGPAPSLEPSDEIPEWLEDMRLWVGLDLYTPAQDELTSSSTSTGEVPDWLESWSKKVSGTFSAPVSGPLRPGNAAEKVPDTFFGSASRRLARPKSLIFGVPSARSRILAGLRSR